MKTIEIEYITQKFVNNFWSKVWKTDNCWLWTGYTSTMGYGTVKLNQEQYIASRMVYYFRNKVDPYPLCVLHKCDNSICVNPDHLYLGTHQDNMRDMVTRGRARNGGIAFTVSATQGIYNRHVKLTEAQVLEIRNKYLTNTNMSKLAREYNVTDVAVYYIVNRITWKHI